MLPVPVIDNEHSEPHSLRNPRVTPLLRLSLSPSNRQITNSIIWTIANEQCSLQVRYAAQEISQAKSARARGSYLRVSFKNTRETAQAINGMKLSKALTFLENVTTKTMAVPMRRYAGSTGRTAQGEFP